MEEKDKQLYKLFFCGDNYAVKEIISRFRNDLILFVNGFLHDINQAEDIVSDTFVKIIIKRPKLKNESSFKTYIYQIAKNLCFDYMRKKKREVVFYEDYQISADDEICKNEDKRELIKAISKLKKEYRIIIYLRYFDGFSIDEIAKIMRKNKKQVYNTINRAKIQLKNLLQEVK